MLLPTTFLHLLPTLLSEIFLMTPMIKSSHTSFLSSFSLPVPSILSYNIRSSSFYSSSSRASDRRRDIQSFLKYAVSNQNIICLQETHLAPNEHLAFHFPNSITSLNNLSIEHAGTAIIDSPSLQLLCRLRYFPPRFCAWTCPATQTIHPLGLPDLIVFSFLYLSLIIL